MGKRFLIGQLGAFGDCLYATTLAKQIKNDYPDSHITWAISTKCKSVLLQNPYVDLIWEITNEKNYSSSNYWKTFEVEAEKRKKNGEFDEIIYSQVLPKNIYKYDGTIRSSILKTYTRPITVDVSPVIFLSNEEVQNVKNFVSINEIKKYSNVILFECAPTSLQSNKVNMEFALTIARNIVRSNKNVCFILSSSKKFVSDHSQIIDGSQLSFRENAELTHYCTLLVGCSSGLTWLSTSNWGNKNLPSIQLLDSGYNYFAGVHYDFEIWHLDNSRIVERLNFDDFLVEEMIKTFFADGISIVKAKFHENYRVNYNYCTTIINYGLHSLNLPAVINFIHKQRFNSHGLKIWKIVLIFLKQLGVVFVQKVVSLKVKVLRKFFTTNRVVIL